MNKILAFLSTVQFKCQKKPHQSKFDVAFIYLAVKLEVKVLASRRASGSEGIG